MIVRSLQWVIVGMNFQATDTIAELESQVAQLKQALQDEEFQRQRQLRVRVYFESFTWVTKVYITQNASKFQCLKFHKADIDFLMIFPLLIAFISIGIRSYTQTGENEFRTFTREEGKNFSILLHLYKMKSYPFTSWSVFGLKNNNVQPNLY